MESLLSGVSLRDVLAGRRQVTETTTTVVPPAPEVEETADEAVDDLFDA